MSQTVPNYECHGQELGSSLADLDFSILSDCQVPSPGSLRTCERSPPPLFSSPPREEDAGYGSSAPLSPPLKQEPGCALIKQEMELREHPGLDCCRAALEMDTPRSPLSDGGYSSQGGSPASQPLSPPPAYHHYSGSPPQQHGYPQRYHPAHPVSSSVNYGHPNGAFHRPEASTQGFQGSAFGAGCAAVTQEQLMRLGDSARQRKPAPPPAAFGLELLEASTGQHPGWMSVLDLALEQIRQEKKNVCMLLGISPGESQQAAACLSG